MKYRVNAFLLAVCLTTLSLSAAEKSSVAGHKSTVSKPAAPAKKATAKPSAKTVHQQSHGAKTTHVDKRMSAKASTKAGVKNTSASQHSAGLKTSQLTSAKAANVHTKPASMQHAVRGATSKGKTKPPKAESNQPPNPGDAILLKPHYARTF